MPSTVTLLYACCQIPSFPGFNVSVPTSIALHYPMWKEIPQQHVRCN